MNESVSVAVRFRPLSASEAQDEQTRSLAQKTLRPLPSDIWSVLAGQSLVINSKTSAQFQFDHVFDQSTETWEIFERVARPVVLSAVDGIHGTIFAYGQTSSGKTYTMKGTKEQPGVIPLALAELFRAIREEGSRVFLVKVAYLEVYNETINDLLDARNTNLDVRESLERGAFVLNLTEVAVSSETEALELLHHGEANRKVGETSMNEQSSRSHTIFQVHVESSPVENADVAPVRFSFLNLVDLAGSEGVHKTKAEDMRQREGSNINKSLLALANVIMKLSELPSRGAKSAFINFRDSKLTRMLQTSLSGNSRIVVICTVTEALRHISETTNTLQFGQSAKRIKITAKPNEVITAESQLRSANEEIRRLRTHTEDMEVQVQSLVAEIARMRETNCEKEQQVKEVKDRLESASEEMERMQEQMQAASRHIVNSAGKASLLCTPQSTGKTRMTLSPEVSIHALETLVMEKERRIQTLEQNVARMNRDYEEKYQSLLMENEYLQVAKTRSEQSSLEVRFDPSRDFEVNEQLASLSAKLEEHIREREEIEEIAKDYEVQLRLLQESASAKDTELAMLREALSAERANQARTQLQLQNKVREAQDVAETLSRVTEDYNAVYSKKCWADAEFARATEKMAAMEQFTEELTQANEKLQQDFSEARTSMGELYEQLEQQVGENERLRAQCAATQLEQVGGQDALQAAREELRVAQERLEEANRAAAAQRVREADWGAETTKRIADLQDKVEKLGEACVSQLGKADSLQAAVAQKEAEIDRLLAALVQKDQDASRLRDALSQKDVEVSGLQRELQQHKAESEERTNNFLHADEISALREQLTSAQQTVTELNSRHSEDCITVNALKGKLECAEQRFVRLEEEVREKAASLRLEHSEKKRKSTQALHQLQVQLEAAQQRACDAEAKVAKKEDEIEELQRRLVYKRLPSDLMDERLKQELTATERYQLQLQLVSGVNKVKELEHYIQRLEDKHKKAQDEVSIRRAQEQTLGSRIRELERKISQLEQDNVNLEYRLCSRKSPCELMPRRVAPMVTPSKTQSQDDEEEVDIGSELKNSCSPQ